MKLTEQQLNKEIDKLRDSTVSKIMIQFLERKVGELNSVDGIESFDEVLGRQNAKRKLREIINRLEAKKPSPKINEYK